MPIVVTGINTEVGKTVVSSIIVEALCFDYCKPYQMGEPPDVNTVKSLISNPYSKCSDSLIKNENLVIEGMGGVLSPYEDGTIPCEVFSKLNPLWIIVSRHYLGSINHTLLTAHYLKNQNVIGIVFIGNDEKKEDFILQKTNYTLIGKIKEEKEITKGTILCYARQFRPLLKKILKPYGIPFQKPKRKESPFTL